MASAERSGWEVEPQRQLTHSVFASQESFVLLLCSSPDGRVSLALSLQLHHLQLFTAQECFLQDFFFFLVVVVCVCCMHALYQKSRPFFREMWFIGCSYMHVISILSCMSCVCTCRFLALSSLLKGHCGHRDTDSEKIVVSWQGSCTS